MRDRGSRVGRSPVATALWAVGRGNKEKSDGAQRRGYNQLPITDHRRASPSILFHSSCLNWTLGANAFGVDSAQQKITKRTKF